jgi:uncharacterized LabA/DUF88 family protein
MIFIDGGHIRTNLREYFCDDVIDYIKFIQFIKAELSLPSFLFDVIRIYYYDAFPDVENKKEKMKNIYIHRIRKLPGFEDRLGSLKIGKKRELKQIGVDTLIAVDMLSKAYENHFDIAILLSGDGDHMPLVDAVKNTGKRVFGVSFEAHESSLLKEYFDANLVLNQDWFVSKALKGNVIVENFVVPDTIKAGDTMQLNPIIETSLAKIILKLLIADPDGSEYCSRSEIIRSKETEEKQIPSSLNIIIPSALRKMQCKAFLIVYDDHENEDNIIAYRDKEFEVI